MEKVPLVAAHVKAAQVVAEEQQEATEVQEVVQLQVALQGCHRCFRTSDH